MTREEEAKFDHWAEKQFRSQRETPNGRSFLWDTYRWKTRADMLNYRKNFDRVFPKAPGARM